MPRSSAPPLLLIVLLNRHLLHCWAQDGDTDEPTELPTEICEVVSPFINNLDPVTTDNCTSTLPHDCEIPLGWVPMRVGESWTALTLPSIPTECTRISTLLLPNPVYFETPQQCLESCDFPYALATYSPDDGACDCYECTECQAFADLLEFNEDPEAIPMMVFYLPCERQPVLWRIAKESDTVSASDCQWLAGYKLALEDCKYWTLRLGGDTLNHLGFSCHVQKCGPLVPWNNFTDTLGGWNVFTVASRLPWEAVFAETATDSNQTAGGGATNDTTDGGGPSGGPTVDPTDCEVVKGKLQIWEAENFVLIASVTVLLCFGGGMALGTKRGFKKGLIGNEFLKEFQREDSSEQEPSDVTTHTGSESRSEAGDTRKEGTPVKEEDEHSGTTQAEGGEPTLRGGQRDERIKQGYKASTFRVQDLPMPGQTPTPSQGGDQTPPRGPRGSHT